MDLNALLAAYLALSSGHALNHLSVANQTGAPASLHFREGTEHWARPSSEAKKVAIGHNQQTREMIYGDDPSGEMTPAPFEAMRNAAGFSGQDTLNSAMNTPESNMANALHKGIYLAGGHKLFGGNETYKNGDIGGIAENSGVPKNAINAMILSTIIDDLRRAAGKGDPNRNVSFSTFNRGTPGVNVTWRMKDLPFEKRLFGK